MNPTDVTKELDALRSRLAELERERAERRDAQRRSRRRLIFAASTIAVVAGTAYAANGNCPNGLPVCFAANSPAVASDVNYDFAQLKEWLETKVGAVSAAAVTASNITTSGLTVNTGNVAINNGALNVNGGNLVMSNGRVTGTNSSGNLHIDNTGANSLYLNWFSGNGVVFGNGASGQVGKFDNTGILTVSNCVYSQYNNKRAPSIVVTNSCSAATCAASCPAGTTVKMGFGFHGLGAAGISGDWNCGGGFQWLGSCVGTQGCSVTTSCGSSGVWVECW